MEQAPFHPATDTRPSLDEWILNDPEASFIMQMQGDAMHDHGIYHGDMLIIERTNEARANDIVISTNPRDLDNGWSISTYKSLHEIREQEPITVHAVVRGLVRRYG
jgi:DNA polymerase V